LLSLLVRLALISRPLANLDGFAVPDDCYYVLDIARSMALGDGPSVGSGPTNGFQPLFAFLMVPAFWIFDDLGSPVRAALIVNTLFDTAALYLLARIASRYMNIPAIAAMMILWALSPYFIANAVNGLETSLAYCLLLAAVGWYLKLAEEDFGAPRKFFAFGLLAGLCSLARVDTTLLLPVAALAMAPAAVRVGWRRASLAAFATASGAILVNLPWWTYSYVHTGLVYQVSGQAVRHISTSVVDHSPTWANWYWPQLAMGIRTVTSNNAVILALLGLSFAMLAVFGRKQGIHALAQRLWSLRVVWLFGAALFLAYTLYVFGDWFFGRYLFPLAIALLIAFGLTLDLALRWIPQRGSRRIAAVAVLGPTAMLPLGDPALHALFLGTDTQSVGNMNAGLWARSNLPSGTVVGSTQSGALGYFAEQVVVINLDGVVNREAYEAMRDKRLTAYVRSSGVELILGWKRDLNLLRSESSGVRDDEFVVDHEIPGFKTRHKTWYVMRLRSPGDSPPAIASEDPREPSRAWRY
ncbi:MAG: hypothetical protein ACYC6C_12610, partial [Coriobacteriia bacterium]